ncbi:hypothetical protein ACFU7Y_35450 [Kitasatospora sp. NPDC057542]|uniref:hypothetical protein n=1 Tax=Streptomycetaceae TaxID=2062 RepID=UPI001CCA99C3|nr:hypothetical protein [Streptomyces sp. LS1784]
MHPEKMHPENRAAPATPPAVLLRAVRHPVTRCLIACLASAVAAAAAEPAGSRAAGAGCSARRSS